MEGICLPSSPTDAPPSLAKQTSASYPAFFQQIQTMAHPPLLGGGDRPVHVSATGPTKHGRSPSEFKAPPGADRKLPASAADGGIAAAGNSYTGSPGSVACSSTQPYRSFPEVALTEIGAFLQKVNRELEQIHLRHSLEKGEYFTLFAGDNISDNSIVMQSSDTMSFGKSTSTASYNTNPKRRSGGDREEVGADVGDTDMVALMKQTVFPFAKANNMFQYPGEAWFRPLDFGGGLSLEETPLVTASDPVAVAVTEDPPLFECGMLYDPISELFLFGGTGFTEEARVLSAPLPTDAIGAKSKTDPRARLKHAKILVREYLSISKRTPLTEEGNNGDSVSVSVSGSGAGGFIVQTLSLLDPDTDVDADKRILLSSEKVQQVLPLTMAGTLTRVFIVPRPGTDSASNSGTTMPRAEGNMRLAGGDSSSIPLQRSSWTNWAARPSLQPDAVTASIDAYIMENAAFLREPIGDEAALRYTNPKLYVWSLQHDPASLLDPTDTIRVVLEFYTRNQVLYTGMRRLVRAVKTLQRFFRMCAARKERAKQHMLQLWRHLELESRFKLQHYQPPPSSIERVDMIANNVLQKHMVTSREYKLQLLEELWQQRHADYVKWRAQQAQDAQFLKQMKRSYLTGTGEDEIFASNAVEQILQRAQEMEEGWPRRSIDAGALRKTAPFREGITASSSGGEEEETMMEVEEDSDHRSSPEARAKEKSKSGDRTDEDDADAPPLPTFSVKRWTTAAGVQRRSVAAREEREETYMHQHFGWYIPPEKLLYESHRRLLTSLKNSVLTLEHAQDEAARGGKEKGDVPAPLTTVATNAFASPNVLPPSGDTVHPMNFALAQPLPAIGTAHRNNSRSVTHKSRLSRGDGTSSIMK